jgi:NADPH:quinone reductase-like Zn-dependent oxidoreductase
VFFIVEPNREQLESLASHADAGTVRPPRVETFPLTEASRAFARSLQPGGHGKVVLILV